MNNLFIRKAPHPNINRIKGCLFGVAIGDSLGMPVETLKREEISRRYGYVNSFLPLKTAKTFRPPASFTDEGHLTILTAGSILEKKGVDVEHMTHLFIDALDNPDAKIAGTTRQALIRRAQGQDLVNYKVGRMHGGAGAGAAGRIAPVAIYEYHDMESLFAKTDAVSRITHQDDDAVASAVSVAYIIAKAMREELNPDTLLFELGTLMEKMGSNLVYNFQLADDLLKHNVDTLDGIEEIGADGYCLRVIPSAVFSFLKSPDNFEETVLSAVNAGGDTDTRASIAGAISGAYNGFDKIPLNWTKKIEKSSLLDYYSESFYMSILDKINSN